MSRIIPAFEQFLDTEGNPLIDGSLHFFASGTTTDKTTWADAAMTIPNPNPVPLDASGFPEFDIFGDGTYKVISLDSGGQLKLKDPVGGDTSGGAFSDYVASTIYNIPDVVRGLDGEFYRTFVDNNKGAEPTDNPELWELLQFGRVWNNFKTYTDIDTVYGSDGKIYISVGNGNIGNNPTTDDGSNWSLLGGGAGGGQQLDYSADVTIPTVNKVITLNPASLGLVATYTTTQTGDIARLINISLFDTTVKLSGTGFLSLPAGETAFLFRVDTDWYSVVDENGDIESDLLTFGISEIFNSAITNQVAVTSLTSTKIVVGYSDDGNSGAGTCKVGTISGSTISFGSSFVFDTDTATSMSLDRLTDTKFAVSYRDGGTGFGTCVIADVSGTTISFGSVVVFNSASTLDISITRVTDTKLCITYRDVGNSSFGTAILANISGTVPTFGSEVVFESASTSYTSATRLTDTKIAVAYTDVANSNAATSIVATIAGTVPTFGTAVVFDASASSFISIARLTDDKYAVGYFDSGIAGGAGKGIIADVSGTFPTFGTTVIFKAVSITSLSIAALSDTTIAIGYVTGTVGEAILGEISGTVIAFGTEVIFNSGFTDYIAVTDLTTTEIAIAYSGVSRFGTAAVGEKLTV